MTTIVARHHGLFNRLLVALHHTVDHADHLTHLDPHLLIVAVGAAITARHGH